MARTRKTVTIDEKIEIAQKKIDSIKVKLESAQAELNSLIAKKEEEKKDELWAVIENSGKSIEEIIDLIK